MEEFETQKPLLEHLTKKDPLIIELEEYGYSCSDGCCYNYGTITKVNGIELPLHNQDVETILSEVLTHLGYVVKVKTKYDLE